MKRSARAMVQTGPGVLELQEFAIPDAGDDGAVLRVEACGICGTDLETYRGSIPLRYPVVPGHEAVGIIETIGASASRAWGVVAGDRVIVPAELACGQCASCQDGNNCLASPGTHGFLPTSVEPSLWGGFSDYMYLSPQSRPIKINSIIDASIAALFNPLGAGFAWAVDAPNLQPGQSIVIFGPGQRGLASVIAAKSVGASQIFVTGFGARDRQKLELAESFGADLAINTESDSAVDAVLAATDGKGVDVVVDTTPHALQPIHDALRIVRPGGTIILAGMKGNAVDGFPTDEIAMRRLTIKGVRAVDTANFKRAVALIETSPDLVAQLHTHNCSLEDAAKAIELLANGDGIAITLRT